MDTTAAFDCIPGQEVQRERREAGSYVDGTWTRGDLTTEDVSAVIHPLTSKKLLSERMIQTIDNDRTLKYMLGYALPGTFREMSEEDQIEPDIAVYQGERLKVMMIDEWTSGVLNHQKILFARLNQRDDS